MRSTATQQSGSISYTSCTTRRAWQCIPRRSNFALAYDLGAVDLSTIPKTGALLDQKIASVPAERGWWLDVLVSGQLPRGCERAGDCPAQRLFDSYVLHASKSGVRRRSIETTIGMFLNKVAPGLRRRDGHYKVWSVGEMVETPGSVYEFPPLAGCREAFAKLMQQDFEWGGPEEWREVPRPDVEAGGPM